MRRADIVATSTAVAATRSRKAKVAALAEALRAAEPAELETVVSYLGGSLRQRRTGLGWRGVADLPEPAAESSLTVAEVHECFDALAEIAEIAGTGSQTMRKVAVTALAQFGLEVGRPVLTMLASSAPDIEAAMAKAVKDGPVSGDAKLDGIRIQAHRWGDEALMMGPEGRPRPFQETASRTAQATGAAVVPYCLLRAI